MKSNRPYLGMVPFILLTLGNVVTAVPAVNTQTDLDCTNDFDELMFCQLKAENCPEYSLTLKSPYSTNHCDFQMCGTGQCCCSAKMMIIYDDIVTATVNKGGLQMESKVINITDTIKPIAPTIVSVKESNGNFEVQWRTNREGFFSESLTASVTYYKKGDTEKVSESVERITVDKLRYYSGQCLKPNSIYVVSVRSYIDWSKKYSDSSEEWELKTGNFNDTCSQISLFWAIIIGLSVFAVLITGAIYGCYVKYKTKWWDTVASPKLLIHPNHQEFLKPEPLFISSVCVEPPLPDDSKPWLKTLLTDSSSESTWESSGISTGSSCLSYANTEPADIIAGVQDALCKALPNISPISPVTTSPFLGSNKDSGFFSVLSNPCGAVDIDSGSSGFDNKSYSIFIPSSMQQNMTDSSEVQPQAEMVCESAYHPSEGDTLACAEQQVALCPLFDVPLQAAPLMPTDMSYHQCSADSASAEDSGLSSASRELVSRVEAACESFDELVRDATHQNGMKEEALLCDENPCYGHGPAGSHGFLQVEDDYQAFQNLLVQPDALFSVSGENEDRLDNFPQESFAKIPQVIPGFINSVHGGQCLPELHRPVISLMSAHMPVITESGYQSV